MRFKIVFPAAVVFMGLTAVSFAEQPEHGGISSAEYPTAGSGRAHRGPTEYDDKKLTKDLEKALFDLREITEGATSTPGEKSVRIPSFNDSHPQ